jgi:outer membrane protein assembly factor BamB
MRNRSWRIQTTCALVTAWLVFSPNVAHLKAGDAWTGFQNGGQLKVDALPDSWDAGGKNIAWQAAIDGYGQSSPVVLNDRVFITSTSGPNKEKYHVAAYSLTDGTRQWRQDFANPSPEENNNYVSRAAPTPAIDAQGVFISFEGGLIVASTFDGKIRWQKNLVEAYGPVKARHGLSASLEQDDQHLFVWVEREADPYVVALRKDSGETVWKAPGVGATSWSSPRLITVDGHPQLVCSASGRIAGYDAKTGDKLWEFTDIANNTTCTPIPVGDSSFVIGASDGRGEQAGGTTAPSSGLIAIQATPEGKYAATYKWRADKATCSFGSPIVAGNRVWLVNRSGVLYQLDLETGEQISAERISAGSVWATPLATENRLYLFGKAGMTSIIDLANAAELSTCTLWDASDDAAPPAGSRGGAPGGMGGPVLYAAVIASDTLLIRRGDTLFAIRQSQ